MVYGTFSEAFPGVFDLGIMLCLEGADGAEFGICLCTDLLLCSHPCLFPLVGTVVGGLRGGRRMRIEAVPGFRC